MMTPQEQETLTRLQTYGNLSREDALELHRLLNLQDQEQIVVQPEGVEKPTVTIEDLEETQEQDVLSQQVDQSK